jgi:shikimate dehydrogenase
MQAAALRAVGLPDWTYEIREVAPEGLTGAIEELRVPPWRGANVTVPHKEAACRAVDVLTAEAQAIGAVNTIVADAGRLVGHNTDGGGFLDAVGDVRGAICAVLGSGGSARAVVHALRTGAAEQIRVVARRAVQLPGATHQLAWSGAALAGCDLIVGCTPPEAVPPPLDALSASARVIDLVYYQSTGLLRAAADRGLRAEDGRGVLLHQGARSFTLWTERPAPIDVMRAALPAQ